MLQGIGPKLYGPEDWEKTTAQKDECDINKFHITWFTTVPDVLHVNLHVCVYKEYVFKEFQKWDTNIKKFPNYVI